MEVEYQGDVFDGGRFSGRRVMDKTPDKAVWTRFLGILPKSFERFTMKMLGKRPRLTLAR